MVIGFNIIVLVFGYVIGFIVSTLILRRIFKSFGHTVQKGSHDLGLWIGLCEHFLIVTFVLVNEYTAIGLIFAAKEYVRLDKIKAEPQYYLLGTLLNTCMALFFGIITKFLMKVI